MEEPRSFDEYTRDLYRMGLHGFVQEVDGAIFFEDKGTGDHPNDHPVVDATGAEVSPIVDIPGSVSGEKIAPAECVPPCSYRVGAKFLRLQVMIGRRVAKFLWGGH